MSFSALTRWKQIIWCPSHWHVLQVYLYISQHSDNDRPFLKFFVSWLFSVFQCPYNSTHLGYGASVGLHDPRRPANGRLNELILNRVLVSIQMLLLEVLVHAYYIAGITNFDDFIADQKVRRSSFMT